jgi:hypothetical protein
MPCDIEPCCSLSPDVYVSNIRSHIFLINSYKPLLQELGKQFEHGPFKVKVFKFLKEKYN